jgi:DNA-binding CsgD family transcriptional regulator
VEYGEYLRILESESFNELTERVHRVVELLGFDGFLYLAIVGQTPPGEDPELCTVSSYDPAFIDRYRKFHCYRYEPAAIHIRQHQYPTPWGRDSFKGTRADDMYQTARGFGICSGATFPVVPPSVTIAGFGYACNLEIEESLPHILETMAEGQLLATFTHRAVMRLTNLSPAPRASTITGRERACLDLAAQGLRDGEIAGRLGISTRTVLFHLNNARNKLNAENRAQMIARAMALRVIGI